MVNTSLQIDFKMKKQPKTFAERARDIERKFKGRNDNVSKRTKESLYDDLRAEQEAIKAQRGEGEPNQHAGGGTLDNGIVAEAGVQSGLDGNARPTTVVQPNQNPATIQPLTFNNSFAEGGRPPVQGVNELNTFGVQEISTEGPSTSGIMTKTPEAPGGGAGGPGAAGYLGAAEGAMDLGKMAFGDSGIDTTGATAAPEVKVGASAASGAMKGAKAGMAFGPWGAAIGGVVGGAAGFFGGKKAQKEAEKAQTNYDFNLNNQYKPNDYAYGGKMRYANGGEIEGPKHPTIHLPSNNPSLSEDENLDIRDKYGKRMKLSPDQIRGFDDQRTSDRQYDTDRQTAFQTQYKDWKGQKTGNSPNSKLSASDPVYQKFWTDMRNDYGKNTPRPMNPAVAGYYKEGPAGQGQGIHFDPKFRKIPFDSAQDREMLTDSNAYGGMINKFEGRHNSLIPKNKTTGVGDWLRDMFKSPGVDSDGKKIKSKVGKVLKENAGDALSYAGVVGDLFHKIDPAETPRGSRLNTQYKKSPYDEQRLINQVNSTGVNRALQEASTGDAGALRTNLLAAHLGKQKALGAGMAQADAVNRDEQQKENQFNLRRDSVNVQLDADWEERQAADKGAYETAKENRRASIYGSIAGIGREESNKKIVKAMYGYKYNAKYNKWENDKGESLTNA